MCPIPCAVERDVELFERKFPYWKLPVIRKVGNNLFERCERRGRKGGLGLGGRSGGLDC